MTTTKIYEARIVDGVVVAVLVVPYVGWANEFDVPGQWVNVTHEAQRPGEGWTYDGATFAPPVAGE